jgi:hypothetical protein
VKTQLVKPSVQLDLKPEETNKDSDSCEAELPDDTGSAEIPNQLRAFTCLQGCRKEFITKGQLVKITQEKKPSLTRHQSTGRQPIEPPKSRLKV